MTLHNFEGKRFEKNVKNTYKIFFDIDKNSEETKNRIIKFIGNPTYLIKTSLNPIKFQLIYILNEDVDSKLLKKVVYTLTTHFQTDHTFDLARIFRLPGFKNWKNNPTNIVTYIKNNNTYDINYILNLLKVNNIELLEPQENINEITQKTTKNKINNTNCQFDKNNKYYEKYQEFVERVGGDKSRADISFVKFLKYKIGTQKAIENLLQVRDDIHIKHKYDLNYYINLIASKV